MGGTVEEEAAVSIAWALARSDPKDRVARRRGAFATAVRSILMGGYGVWEEEDQKGKVKLVETKRKVDAISIRNVLILVVLSSRSPD